MHASTYHITSAADLSHTPNMKRTAATLARASSAPTLLGASDSASTLGKRPNSGLALPSGSMPRFENSSAPHGTRCTKCTSRYTPSSTRNTAYARGVHSNATASVVVVLVEFTSDLHRGLPMRCPAARFARLERDAERRQPAVARDPELAQQRCFGAEGVARDRFQHGARARIGRKHWPVRKRRP